MTNHEPQPRPNILLIHSDQHRFDCLGVNGHPFLKTPHLDQLARDGVNFTHAFTPIPLCTPARSCLMHGQWSATHKCIANYDTEASRPSVDDAPCFSEELRLAGYQLGYVGKWHVNAHKDPRDYGFNEYIPESDYAAWREEQGLPPKPRENKWLGEPDPHIAPDQSRLGWGASVTIDMIERFSASSEPFFIRWDPSEPHLPNVVPEPHNSLYPPADIPPWPSFDDPLEGKPYIQRQQRRTWKLDDWTWQDWAPIVGRYLGEITLMDEKIGQVLEALDRLGLAENTLVIYSTDHGDMCGAHGMIDKHFIMYDDVVRVPLIARWPGRIQAGQTYEGFVINELDLAKTFCHAARASIPDGFQGESLLDFLDGEIEPRSDAYSMYHGNQFGLFTQRMTRDQRWKYIWNASAEDELYDLENDPGEKTNLATDPNHAAELDRLRQRLIAWMEQSSDPILNPWTRAQISEGLTV